MTNMWEAATLDYERERLDGYIAAASVAVAEQHGFVIQASTRQEFDDRLALVTTAVERAIDRVTYAEPGSFPTVHQAVLASWERDFDLLTEQRQVEAQRRNARRAFFRRQAEGSKHTAAGRFEWKPKKTSGFKVVDDSSGASTGTVYPNKEIAEQANYGDGYSVQYTDEKVKTAKTAANWQRQQDGPGESHWHLTPADFRPGQWAKISPVGDGFMLSIYAADGGDYTADSLLLHERYESLAEAQEAAEYWRKTASVNKLAVTWSDLGLQQVQTYNGLSERLHLWTAEEMGVTGDVITFMGGYMWYVHSVDDQEGDALASGKESTLEAAQAMAERAMAEHSTQMSLFASKTAAGQYRVVGGGSASTDGPIISRVNLEDGETLTLVSSSYGDSENYVASFTFRREDGSSIVVERFGGLPEWITPVATASKTAGENPFAKKDDDKKDAPKDDQTDSDQDGEQDGPAQPGEQPEPAGDDATAAPAQAAPADQQAAQADPNATQDPAAAPDAAQDKGQAQDPASTADAAQDQQKPSDPTVMDVGQSTSMGFTMADGGSTGSIEVTFVREENGVYFFNGPTGEFGVGQMNGQWQDADGNTFTFGGTAAPDQGIGPAQEQAAAADAATPTPTPAGNAQQPAPAAPADPNAAPAAPATDAAPAADDSAKADPPKDDSGDEKKDDGEKKENPFAKKGD